MEKLKSIFFLIIISLILSANIYGDNKRVNITYVANDGFLIETENKKILIDALFGDIQSKYIESPDEGIIRKMENAQKPFNKIDIIAISHKHRDHFNIKVVIKYLLANPDTKVICPEQVKDILAGSKVYDKIKNNIIAVTPDPYKNKAVTVKGINIKVYRLEHSYYMIKDKKTGKKVNKHQNIENIGFVININGNKIFHCGDANPANESEYATFILQKEKIDIAFLDRLFFAMGKRSINIVNKYINPKHIILMHIGPDDTEKFAKYFKKKKNIKIFMNKMEQKIYEL